MATEGFNWTQLSMSRAGNFPPTGAKYYTAEQVAERGQMWVWHTTFARSIPAVISGMAQELADRISRWTIDDFEREWGDKNVLVTYSPHANFQQGRLISNHEGRRLQLPGSALQPFSSFLDAVRAQRHDEHVSVQQSPNRNLDAFGLPDLPPNLEELVGHTIQARNLWVSTAPRTSVLHYDWQDSVLLQLSGTKRFTLIDPARLQTAYPAVMRIEKLERVSPGVYERKLTEREIDNFPLVNVTHPDYERFPLLRDAHIMTVDVPAGSALILPALWYHQVDSFAEPGQLNVAVNYWFQGHSLATRFYRTLRENVFINCTLPAPPGQPHLCRDSVLEG